MSVPQPPVPEPPIRPKQRLRDSAPSQESSPLARLLKLAQPGSVKVYLPGQPGYEEAKAMLSIDELPAFLSLEGANELPPNHVARSLLLKAGRNPDDQGMLHLLALALWGLEEGVEPSDNNPEPFDQDALAGAVCSMTRISVGRQLEILGWPNDLPELMDSQDPMDAAQDMVDRLWSELSPTNPDY